MRLPHRGWWPQVMGELVAGLVELRESCSAALRTTMVLKTTSSAMRGGILLLAVISCGNELRKNNRLPMDDLIEGYRRFRCGPWQAERRRFEA